MTKGDVRSVLGRGKHVMIFCVFIYVNWNGLIFKANIYEQMKMYLFVHKKPYRAAKLFCVPEKFALIAHWRLQGTLLHVLYILGEGGPGFLTL